MKIVRELSWIMGPMPVFFLFVLGKYIEGKIFFKKKAWF